MDNNQAFYGHSTNTTAPCFAVMGFEDLDTILNSPNPSEASVKRMFGKALAITDSIRNKLDNDIVGFTNVEAVMTPDALMNTSLDGAIAIIPDVERYTAAKPVYKLATAKEVKDFLQECQYSLTVVVKMTAFLETSTPKEGI